MAPVNSALAYKSEKNSVAALRHFTVRSGGIIQESDGVVFAASPDPYCGPFHNAAIRLNRAISPGSLLRRANEFFGTRGRGYILWVDREKDADLEERAVQAGMLLRRPAEGAPDMVVTKPFGPVMAPAGVTVTPVTSADQTATFGKVVADAYTARDQGTTASGAQHPAADATPIAVPGEPQPKAAAIAMFREPGSLLAPEAYAVIAYLNGQPVSCAVKYQTGDVAGVYWVSTVREARRCGLAELVTKAVVNEGFRHGARLAALQASSMGYPVYQRMGFTVVGRHRRYIHAPPTG